VTNQASALDTGSKGQLLRQNNQFLGEGAIYICGIFQQLPTHFEITAVCVLLLMMGL
jgi:hypothetical protein